MRSWWELGSYTIDEWIWICNIDRGFGASVLLNSSMQVVEVGVNVWIVCKFVKVPQYNPSRV